MKRCIAYLAFAAACFGQGMQGNWTPIPQTVYSPLIQGLGIYSNTAGMFLQTATDAIAVSFIATPAMATGSGITAADWRFLVTGTVTNLNNAIQVQADSAGSPSGTVLGASSAGALGPAALGYWGLQTLGTPSGTLTVNNKYWLIVYPCVSASLSCTNNGSSSPTSSNYYEAQNNTTADIANAYGNSVRHGTACSLTTGSISCTWGAATTAVAMGVVLSCSGTYFGTPAYTSSAVASGNHLFGTNIDGMVFTLGANATLQGVWFKAFITGSPTQNLNCDLKSGGSATAIATASFPLAQIVSNAGYSMYFSSAQSLTAGTLYYIGCYQASSGGTSGNYFALSAITVTSAYATLLQPASQYEASGSVATAPGSLTATANTGVMAMPIFGDPASSLSGGSSGSYTFPIGQ